MARSVVYEDPHRHTSELARWDQRFPEPAEGGLAELIVAAVRAAVVAPERELPRWFPWWEDGLAERLVAEGRLARPAERLGHRSGNGRRRSAGSTCAVTQTGVVA